MKLSIILITYNQEKYIRECLEGLIIQNLPSDYEIIIADDYSTDNTLVIIKETLDNYKLNYIILNSTGNLGITENYKRAYFACEGEYIAILEGDDYWTDPTRILHHIDFLDRHRECVMSFNRYVRFFEDDLNFDLSPFHSQDGFEYITSRDLARGNKLGNLSTCVIRASVFKKLDKEFFEMGFADWFLGLALGQYGLIAKLKEVSSVYRIHSQGAWSSSSKTEQIQSMLELIDKYNKCLNYKFNTEFLELKNHLTSTTNKTISNKNKWKNLCPPIIIVILKLLIPPYFLNKIN